MKQSITKYLILSVLFSSSGCSTQAVTTTGKDGKSATTTNVEPRSSTLDSIGNIIIAIGLAGMLITAGKTSESPTSSNSN